MTFLSGLSLDDLKEWCLERGFEPYRAGQILDWIYRKGAADAAFMKNLPRNLIEALLRESAVHDLKVVERARSHRDHSVKYLFELADGELVEAVWMPQTGFKTVCVSTQVGCPLQCAFCASGRVRFKRNLLVHEMVAQILVIHNEQSPGQRPGHIVFMGMGEPLLNLDHLLKTILILKEPWGFGIGARRITVSTAGYVPGILRWLKAPRTFRQVRLSISLHATRDEERSRIMPINQKYGITALMAALNQYRVRSGRRVTFEYLLLKGINDSKAHARELFRSVQGIAHSVNVIEYNEIDGSALERSGAGEDFVAELRRCGLCATYRRSKGRDIEAACGQLRGRFIKDSVQRPA